MCQKGFLSQHLNIRAFQNFDPFYFHYKPVAKTQGLSSGEQWDGLQYFVHFTKLNIKTID